MRARVPALTAALVLPFVVSILFALVVTLTASPSESAPPPAVGSAPPPAVGSDEPELSGWAVLPADTFVPGSEESGRFTGNPAALFPGQPVQGFSGIHALPGGSYLVMSDNGFGAKANSQDFRLRVHRIRPRFGSEAIDVLGGFHLSDPDRHIPWTTWRDGGCAEAESAGTLPGGYACPVTDRQLTGWDFDLESMQVARDGTLWFGEEFGPFLLHADRRGRLLESPIPTPGVKSPSNPTLAPGEQPNLAGSKGFEGLAIGPAGRRLFPMLEGPTAEDQAAGLAADLRIYEVRLRPGTGRTAYTGEFWRYRMESPAHAIGDFIAINRHQFLVIERDGGSGPTAVVKRVYLVDLADRDDDGYVDKTLLVDLMDLANPDGLGPVGDPFSFPYVTIEDVDVLDRDTIVVLNDNNYPGTGGRGPDVKDVNEFLRIDLDRPLDVDRRLLP